MTVRSDRPAREPIFNLPGVLIGTIAALVLVHVVLFYVLSDDQANWALAAFAFVPIRLTGASADGFYWPGGIAGDVWTFFTYALLHAGWLHLISNSVWLAAFGAPVARRFGWWRFLVFALLGAGAGALLHFALFPHGQAPLVGASAGISALMAASARFAFSPGGRLGGGYAGPDADHRPALTIAEMLRDRRVLTFVGAWFVFNILFGLIVTPPGVGASTVAWEAHLGGFLFGLLGFPLLDPVRRPRRD